MQMESTLFALRVVSGGLLLIMLALMFAALWLDYRSAVRLVEASRRSYGRLIQPHNGTGEPPKVYPLLPLTSIGRAPTNTIVLDDDFASGEHCIVALRSGQWWLEDRGSRNGTMINGVLINHAVIVTSGDVIGVGKAQFHLELET